MLPLLHWVDQVGYAVPCEILIPEVNAMKEARARRRDGSFPAVTVVPNS
jgi:hypothetical protein